MIAKVRRSKCCNAEVKTDGLPDFIGSKKVCTVSFTCLECRKSCDTKEIKVLEMNVNDEIEVRLTLEGRRIYREYWKKYAPRRLPFKRGRVGWINFQLWDFMHIFGNAISMSSSQIIVDNTIRILKP